MDAKPFYQSKTLWINLLTGAAALFGAFGIDLGLDEETKTKIVVGLLAFVNIVMRFITKQPVGA